MNYKKEGSPRSRKLPGIRFVQTEYRQGGALPVARLPSVCAYSNPDEEGVTCDVVLHHLRPRKTGSVDKIVVCWCWGHGKGFGLYPPDGVPYARVPWSSIGVAGETLRVVEDEPPSASRRKLSGLLMSFLPTYPGAAVDEGRGVFWPTGASWKDPPGSTHPRQETQVRRSLRTLRVLGIAGEDIDKRDRLSLSEVLGVPLAQLQALEAGVPEVGECGAPEARGFAVMAALEALPDVTPRFQARKLAVAGYLAGVWGKPWAFDADSQRSWCEPFRRFGTEGLAM